MQGLAEDDVVVALVCKEGETFVEVELEDADAACGGGDEVVLVEGDSESGDVFLLGEVLHEFAVAGAEVEDGAVGGDEMFDLAMVESLAGEDAAVFFGGVGWFGGAGRFFVIGR